MFSTNASVSAYNNFNFFPLANDIVYFEQLALISTANFYCLLEVKIAVLFIKYCCAYTEVATTVISFTKNGHFFFFFFFFNINKVSMRCVQCEMIGLISVGVCVCGGGGGGGRGRYLSADEPIFLGLFLKIRIPIFC